MANTASYGANNCSSHFENRKMEANTNFISSFPRMNIITFRGLKSDSWVKINFDTGEIEFSEGLSMPEAAKAFWDAVGFYWPGKKDAV
jgi:hypothetical protein